MPRNLDDFELERTPYTPRDDDEQAPPPEAAPESEEPAREQENVAPEEPDAERTRLLREDLTELPGPRTSRATREGRRLVPAALVALALLAFGILAVVYFVFRPPATPSAAKQPTVGQPAAVPAIDEAALPVNPDLPSLEDSDGYVRRLAASLSTHPELARWLAQGSLVRTLTAVVTNVVDGETPRPHLGFLAPAQRFRVRGDGKRIVPDPASFAGYDRFADAVATVDTASAVRVYRQIEPLFEAAYRELGHPDGRFQDAIERGADALLAVPALGPDVELVPHAIGFRYADPRLEALTAAQKQFLRLGPRNVRKIQAKLRELRPQLAAPEARPTSSRAR